jgi:CBS domain-containing protein
VLEEKRQDSGAWLWCSKDDLVIDAVKKMTKGNVGSLLVFDPEKINIDQHKKMQAADSGAVVGIITERDYLTKVVVLGKSSSSLHVREIMTPQNKLMTISPNQSVLEVMSMMIDNNFRHVPVVHQGQYLGMISIRDVVNVMVQEHREEIGRLNEYIQGSY